MTLSHHPAYLEQFVKTCAALNLDTESIAMLLDASARMEIEAHPAYTEAFQTKVAMLGRIGGVADKALKWMGTRAIAPLAKGVAGTPTRAGITAGIGAAGAGVAGAKSLWDHVSGNYSLGRAFADMPGGYTGDGVGASEATGAGANIKNPFDYIARTSRAGNWGSGGGAAPGASGNPRGSFLSSLTAQHGQLAAQKNTITDTINEITSSGDPARISQIPRLKQQFGLLDTQSNLLQSQMTDLTSRLTDQQTRMHDEAGRGLSAVGRLLPRYEGDMHKFLEMGQQPTGVSHPINSVQQWWHGGKERIQDRAQHAADMLQTLRLREQTLRKAQGTPLLPAAP